jgi:syntaxin 1B/2/3
LSLKNTKKSTQSIDIESPQELDSSKSSTDMDQFYAQVSVIKALMADIKDLQSRLEMNNERTKTAVRTAQVHELREKMQQDANTISKEAEQIKSYLKQLDAENAAAMKKKGQGKGSASERTRSAVTGALKKKLKESMDEFQELRERLMADYRETVERRVYTVTGEHATEAQIDHMIDEGEGEMIFQKAIMEQGRGYVMDTVAELRERRDAVLELERSLMELHQVFLDMAVLVEAQGEMIDNIENQVCDVTRVVLVFVFVLVLTDDQRTNERCGKRAPRPLFLFDNRCLRGPGDQRDLGL